MGPKPQRNQQQEKRGTRAETLAGHALPVVAPAEAAPPTSA
ncbi:hypothetical protein [Mucilaginibacter polytrichastri]|uniref:Uncharacterized protein n=1 Tax=Mucilaginibacter polytrichastri TaxID=1302689 RepID=A0A1Q6A3Y0_9SPHI|nr:hypothetical protein [Mucilaginibacter polytrichastri]OKS88719.1 hypothetical protein RG47T_4197 [Mucilaginibacter polytrichastri]